jgi:hypothetical protein
MLAQPNAEVIVVDYLCPDETWRWISETFQDVKVVRVTGVDGFNLADARNRGASVARGERLAFVDADMVLADKFISYINLHMAEGKFGHFARNGRGMHGTCVVPKRHFDLVGGYDDLYQHWGGEDVDLYARLANEARLQAFVLPDYLSAEVIQHSDAERTKFHNRPKKAGFLITRLYTELKLNSVERLPREQRKQLYDSVCREVDRTDKEGISEISVAFRHSAHSSSNVIVERWTIVRTKRTLSS